MASGAISSEQYFIEEDYGDGTEISTTGFFIFGIPTFWIYTIWKFHGLLTTHIRTRLQALRNSRDLSKLSSTEQKTMEIIIRHGFDPKSRVRNICVILCSLCVLAMSLELIAQILLEHQYMKTQAFDAFTMITVTLMALMFCLSSVLFISWVCKTIKNHEYYELLLVKWNVDPTRFRMSSPSNTFVQRWNRNQNWVGFFLVLAVPMTVSPAVAIYHVYEVIAEGGDVVFTIQVWSAVIFALAAVFHLWGTQLLIDMYNGHLRIEAVNQQHLRGENPWMTQGSRSILEDYQKKEGEEKSGDLVPLRTLAAIMITDIVGFSKDMEKDETRTYAKLMIHNKTIRTVITQYGGEEIKTIGDAFLVRFKSAVDAVRAGVAIQTEFRGYNAQRPEEERILVRIGIHIGDILVINRDILGDGVNIAARIEPLAEPGGICISADVYNVVKKVISLNVVNIGRKELKNIAEAPEIFRVLIDKEV